MKLSTIKPLMFMPMLTACCMLFWAGCAEVTSEKIVKVEVGLQEPIQKIPITEPVAVRLKFTEQDSTTYKVTSETRRKINWEGSVPAKPAFQSGQTSTKVEMTFEQIIQSVDNNGEATAEITIKELKYLTKTKEGPVTDFDSSKAGHKKDQMAGLVGQSYKIKITPAGEVSVLDVSDALAAVKGPTPAHKAVMRLLTTDAITRRHGQATLPSGARKLLGGDNWSSVKTFSFGLMGSKSYDRVYTLKEIEKQGGRQFAEIEMNAVPTSKGSEQLHKQQESSDLSKMFDNPTETYTGRLKLDLNSGKIEKYDEQLVSEWVVIRPMSKEKRNEEPVALTMGAARLYRIERVK